VTRDAVLAWLHARRPVPPETLRQRLERAVEQHVPPARTTLPAYLAQVGSALLDGVVRQPKGGRELALDLLAADAFATYAFEAQAEHGGGSGHET